MKILLIGNRQTADDPEQYYEQYLDFFRSAVAITGETADLQKTLFDDLYIEVGDGVVRVYDTRNHVDIKDVGKLLIRGKGFRNFFDVLRCISAYAAHHNVPVINDYSGFRDSSKLGQALTFELLGLPVASTVYVTQAVLDERHALPFGFPCIMKATFGAHGNDNYLVHSLEEVKKIQHASPDLRFVLQRFVPNDNDFRLLVVGDTVLAIARKAVGSSHLNNTSQGGTAYLVDLQDLPPRMIEDAVRVARHLDMSFAGVDALIDSQTGAYSFLEVNSQPQLMSGAFVDEKAKLVGAYLMNDTASDS